MQKLLIVIPIIFALFSCEEFKKEAVITTPYVRPETSSSITPEVYDRYKGVVTISCGPRGGVYDNTLGKSLSYRIFRVELINDTLCPVELNLSFPNELTVLYPDTNQKIHTFLLPDELTPDTIQDLYNFGIRGLHAFLDSSLNKPYQFKTLIKPKEGRILYIGAITEGLARAKLFIEGQTPRASSLSLKHTDSVIKNKNSFKLLFEIGINPPQNYSLIHCGEINFKE